MAEYTDLRTGRVKCPECGKKGCGFAPHPHAMGGWKDYDKARCRYCGATFLTENGENMGDETIGKCIWRKPPVTGDVNVDR